MTNTATRHADLNRVLVFCIVLIALAGASYKTARHAAPANFQTPDVSQQAANLAPAFRSHFVSTAHNIHTHAASLVELGDGRIRAFWFAGSDEGAQDVEIRSAVFDPATSSWSRESTVATREGTQRALLRYVRKLGNPVAQHARDGTLWLYYVTVSVGGWGGSSITAISSRDDGVTWSRARRLITSPFINISTLVKGTPFFYSDGSIGLPVYHEFIGKYGELLRIGTSGEIIDKQRLSSGKTTLQPIVLVETPQQAIAMMRHSGAGPRRVMETATSDGSKHWSEVATTSLANPDAAITGTVLPDGRILLALNNIEQGRNALSLVISGDRGATWRTVYQLEDQSPMPADPAKYAEAAVELAKGTDPDISDASAYAKSAERNKCTGQSCNFEFSYPYLIQARNGDFHLVYTWNRSYIKHVTFTRAWLDQQVERTADAKLH